MGVQLAEGHQVETEDVNFTDLEVSYHVRDALKSASLGQSDSYHDLLGVLHHTERLTPDEVAMLVTSLKALSGAVSYIDSDHHQMLLSSISGMSLWNYGPDVMDVLVELVVALAAVSGKYLHLCLDMLVRNFVPPLSFLRLLQQPRGLAKKEQVLCRVHAALKEIADLVPLAPLRLEKVIKERMPHKSSKQPWILSVMYVENMLRLDGGAMGDLVGRTMLVEVMNRIVELDVEIGWDELIADDSNKGMFEMELEEQEMSSEAEISKEKISRDSSIQKTLSGNEVAEHLDLLMVFIFEHLKTCHASGRLDQVFEVLLLSFQSTVLHAYKSKFSQFVMFYACSLDPVNYGERFANMLLDIYKNSMYVLEWRMGAVSYLASYLSRANFMSASFVVSVLESLVDWCFTYCKGHNGETNPKAHRVFYSGIQAIMYILCFRMRSVLGVPRIESQLSLLPIQAILKHSLNPLKVCLPSIVHEFLQQARAAQLFSVSEDFHLYGVLESEVSADFGGLERLDMFFPFDPYLLQNSDRFIRPNFIFWSMVRTTYEDDDEDEDEDGDQSEGSTDEDIENDSRDDDRIAMSFEDDLAIDEFDNSLNKMSITPKNYNGAQLQGYKQMPSRIRPSASPVSL
ncbi:hypothetical protein DCAR_0208522 [Daucus carota subsp. sativus]|uniref:RNA polymerase I-specific transcription initiation factor RRN3 n=1 Tax=Daucus carota subsp. sativus TaxID=79200 RepID=A0AAF0WG23_DAUCS|nr:PREDICTED: RNA polymerase I-specific transcription initiation factor rrn3 [Daucus carota subsp. sativus]WOG89285.1 hypothetical protein DCAR_0208522 [Daucus carota subsp. sativus]